MEVLTEVDEARIAGAAGARTSSSGSTCTRPRAEAFARVGEHARPAPDGDGGHARVRPAAEGRRLRVARPRRLLHRPAHAAPTSPSPARSRSTSTCRATSSSRSARRRATCSTTCTTRSCPEDTEAEDYLVYRIFDTLTDAWYPVITAIESRVDGLEAEVLRARPPRAALAHLPAAPGGPRAPPAASPTSATTSSRPRTRSATSPASAAARRSTCATSATTSRRSRGEFHRQYEDLMSLAQTYFNANADRLNRDGDAADRRRHAVRDLDAGHRLLRPELRAGWSPTSSSRDATSCSSASAGCVVPTVVLGDRCSGSSAATGSEPAAGSIPQPH